MNQKKQLQRIEQCLAKLDPSTRRTLGSISKKKTYKKGALLLSQGKICRHSFLVEQGILRKFYLNDGREIVTELLFEEDIALSLDSYTLQQPSREYIQAITDTVVTQISVDAFDAAKEKHPILIELDLLLTEYHALWLENRLFEYRTLDATQRYCLLLKEQPHIIQYIPLTYIASYLGVSLETLSRIRARL